MSPYKERILTELVSILKSMPEGMRALDFGCGDGWFASRLLSANVLGSVVGVDVKRRSFCLIEPVIYDGAHLPYPDESFDLCYAVDVLHHCPVPEAAITEMARCARKYLLIKDHTYLNWAGKFGLQCLDWIGNIRHGIPSPGHYQRGFEWDDTLQKNGWKQVRRLHPHRCHSGALGAASNHLQYLAMYERQ